MLTTVTLFAGLGLLVGGAELLVRGASRLALATGLSPLVVGLTVVALGTSAPEAAIGVDAALRGAAGIAVGNVVGSNIANVLLILGVCALLAPLAVARQLIRLDVPVMIAASVVVLVLALDGRIGRGEGGVLMAAAVVYTATLVWLARREAPAQRDDTPAGSGGVWWRDALAVLAGLALLVLGARALVGAAVEIALALGLSELVIGLTVVAVGTSLPEIAASLVAVRRGQGEMAVGNVVGSNVFNVLAVLGITAVVATGGVPVSAAARSFDLPVMTAVAFACLPVLFTGYRIARWEGALFVGYYVAYVAYLLLDTTGHDAAPVMAAAMLGFVVPLTAVTLAVVSVRAWRARHAPGAGG
jgi:cation:H+ antiporter